MDDHVIRTELRTIFTKYNYKVGLKVGATSEEPVRQIIAAIKTKNIGLAAGPLLSKTSSCLMLISADSFVATTPPKP